MNHAIGHVWIVEDDPATAYLHRLLLKDLSFTGVIHTHSLAETALYQLEKRQGNVPELILLDLHLPGISGWQFLDRLSNLSLAGSTRPKVVVVSNQVTPAHQKLVHAYRDAVGIYGKPLTHERLAIIVRQLFFTRTNK